MDYQNMSAEELLRLDPSSLADLETADLQGLNIKVSLYVDEVKTWQRGLKEIIDNRAAKDVAAKLYAELPEPVKKALEEKLKGE